MMEVGKIRQTIGMVVAVVFMVAAGAMAVSDLYVSGTWRYRIMVVVETPEGIRTGSAVREVSSSTPLIRLPNAASSPSVKGEAVVVDLDKRGLLLALVDWNSYEEVTQAFPFHRGSGSNEGIRYYRGLRTGLKNKLDPTRYPSYPLMVAFSDLNDPKSVKVAMKWEKGETPPYPAKYHLKEDNFEELFGKGVKLKEIIIEITDDPVTWSIEKRLTWLSRYYDKKFDGQRFNTVYTQMPVANSMSSGSFSTRGNIDGR